MNKKEIIARRILGWKLHSWDKWYDFENNVFILDSQFQPDVNLDHAMQIVEKLKMFGYTYTVKENNQVCFNDICATGDTLAQAITNAAYELAEVVAIDEGWL